jgi:restriction system protein
MIEDIRVCIQCKRYSKPVGNKAVQEIVAGMTHWNGTHAVVVSNAGFTKAAQKLAESTGVFLVNDMELENLENRLYRS